MVHGILSAVLAILFCQPAAVQDEKPWAVVTGQSVMEVRAGLRHWYKRLDRKAAVAALDSAGVTNLITGNLRGLDLYRPIGCFVLPGADGLGAIVSFVPVTGEHEFRGFLERHGLSIGAGDQGLFQVQVPLLGTAWLKFDHRHAWFALAADDLRRALPDPAQSVPAVHHKTTLAATIYVERVPAEQREIWARRTEKGLGWLLEGSASKGQLGENLLLPVAGGAIRLLASQARTVTLLVNSDTSQDEFWAEAVIDPRPGTPWTEQAKRLQAKPAKLDLDARTWAKIRRVPEDKANLAATTAFTKPASDMIHLSAEGGESIHLKARMSGAVLAYYAALDKDKPPKERKQRKRERIPPLRHEGALSLR